MLLIRRFIIYLENCCINGIKNVYMKRIKNKHKEEKKGNNF